MDLALHWSGAWPDHVQPLLAALESLPETEHAPEGAVVFCPDAATLAPPAEPSGALLAMVTHPDHVLDPGRGGSVVQALAAWAQRGALFTVPSSTGAATLQAVLDLPSERVRVVPLPLPPQRLAPAPTEGGGDILALSPIAYELLLSATSLLATAGLHPRLLLAAPDAEPIARPGGSAAAFGLLPGREVVAVGDWRAAAASAGAIVLTDADRGTGWTLREALATGRPVVAQSSSWTRDHLAAIGADAYQYQSLPSLVSALAGALRRERGEALESAARDAVCAESWERAAHDLYLALLAAISPQVPATAEAAPAALEREAAMPSPASAPAPAPAKPAPAPVSQSAVGVLREPLAVCVMNPNANGGGGETFMRQLVSAMASHVSAPRVKLVCQVQPGAAFDAGADTLSAAGVQTRIVPQADFAATIREETDGSDVVYYAWSYGSDPPAIPAPLVCTIHDVNWRHFDVYTPEQRAMVERQTPRWIERSRAIVHSSYFARDELERHYGAPSSLTHVIPTAADPPRVPPTDEECASVRRRFALPERFLLSPNGAHRNKNYPALDSALRILRHGGRPVTVVASGMGTEFFHGPDLVGLGYLSAREVQALYAQSDGIVQTTLYEAGSFPMVEAMAAGKPVAISRIPPIVEQIERVGVVAELFEPLDPDDVAQALWRLWVGSPATDPETIAENARAVAARTWDDVAGDYLQLFSELIR